MRTNVAVSADKIAIQMSKEISDLSYGNGMGSKSSLVTPHLLEDRQKIKITLTDLMLYMFNGVIYINYALHNL